MEREAAQEGRWVRAVSVSHQHWHIDVSYINISGKFYYLCSILDGFRWYIVHWDLRERMPAPTAIGAVCGRLRLPRRATAGLRRIRNRKACRPCVCEHPKRVCGAYLLAGGRGGAEGGSEEERRWRSGRPRLRR